LRFGVVALLDVVSSAGGALLGIAMARAGYGYWSLVGMSVGASMFNAVGVWIANPWRPTWPSRRAGVRPLLSFGSHLLVFDIVHYFSRQVDMLLIGSFWGATQLGLYEKAYNLLLQPIAQVSGPLGAIVQPALARAQTDLARYRRFFLGAFELVISISLPVVVAVGLFAREIVLFLLGPKWLESVPIFYYLAPAVTAMVLLNPWGWLTISLGNTSKHRWVGTINAAVIVLSFFIGISGGAKGVALAYSVMLFLTMVPTWWYVTKGTPVHLLDVARNAVPPLIAATIALSVTAFVKGNLQLGVLGYWGGTIIAAMCFAALYAIILFGAFRKWAFFRRLIQELRGISK
jgi:PST family polysaccharide transporter